MAPNPNSPTHPHAIRYSTTNATTQTLSLRSPLLCSCSLPGNRLREVLLKHELTFFDSLVHSVSSGVAEGLDRAAAGSAASARYQVLSGDDGDDAMPSAPTMGVVESAAASAGGDSYDGVGLGEKRGASAERRGSFSFVSDVANFLSGRSKRMKK